MLICINDKKQPQGAEVIEGREYEMISSRINSYGQKIVFLEGVANNGTTSKGLQWNGYSAERFKDTEDLDELVVEEVNYAMN